MGETRDLELTAHISNDAIVFVLSGTVAARHASLLTRTLDLARRSGASRITVDLGDASSVDARVIEILGRASRAAQQQGLVLRVVSVAVELRIRAELLGFPDLVTGTAPSTGGPTAAEPSAPQHGQAADSHPEVR